jgi:DNA-directed RNA polymerase specialized sigma24 family protein
MTCDDTKEEIEKMADAQHSLISSNVSTLSETRRNDLANRHYALAIKYAYMARRKIGYTLDEDAIASAAHDGLVKTLRCWRSDGDRGFKTYLFQSVRGKAIDTVRAEMSRMKSISLSDISSIDSAMIDWGSDITGAVELLEEIAACESLMSKTEWRCFVAHMQIGMIFKKPCASEIAKAVGCSKWHSIRSIRVALGVVRARLGSTSVHAGNPRWHANKQKGSS